MSAIKCVHGLAVDELQACTNRSGIEPPGAFGTNLDSFHTRQISTKEKPRYRPATYVDASSERQKAGRAYTKKKMTIRERYICRVQARYQRKMDQ